MQADAVAMAYGSHILSVCVAWAPRETTVSGTMQRNEVQVEHVHANSSVDLYLDATRHGLERDMGFRSLRKHQDAESGRFNSRIIVS